MADDLKKCTWCRQNPSTPLRNEQGACPCSCHEGADGWVPWHERPCTDEVLDLLKANKVPVADSPSVAGDPAPVEPTVGQPTAPGVGRPDPVLRGQQLARRILAELDRDDGGTI